MSDDRKQREYVYRCRLCGELKGGAVGCFSLTDAVMVFIEMEQNGGGVYRPGAVITNVSHHHCKDGGFGISDLVGVRDNID